MKITLVRAAVLSLALVGFGAASMTNKAMASDKVSSAKLCPIPGCGPNNTCGF